MENYNGNRHYILKVIPSVDGVVTGTGQIEINKVGYDLHKLDFLETPDSKDVEAIDFLAKTLSKTILRRNLGKNLKIVIELEDTKLS